MDYNDKGRKVTFRLVQIQHVNHAPRIKTIKIILKVIIWIR